MQGVPSAREHWLGLLWEMIAPNFRTSYSTENHDAGGSESNFREKFAPAVADPAIMTGLVI